MNWRNEKSEFELFPMDTRGISEALEKSYMKLKREPDFMREKRRKGLCEWNTFLLRSIKAI